MSSALVLLTLAGCMEQDLAQAHDTAADTDVVGESTDPPPDDTDGSYTASPQFFSVDGTLALVGGEVDTAASALTIGFWTAAGPICPENGDDTRGAVTLTTAVDATVPADV